MVLVNDKLRAWIRTVVPGLWSVALTIVATRLHAHLTTLQALGTALGGLGVLSGLLHKLEARFKWASFFLGARPYPTKVAVPAQYKFVLIPPSEPVVKSVVESVAPVDEPAEVVVAQSL